MESVLRACGGPCACGETHQCSLREIRMEQGALALLPELMQTQAWARPVIVCDANTRRAAGDQAAGLLSRSGMVCLNPENLHADEHGVTALSEALPKQMPENPDVLLAVGAGTIHDLTRYVAHRRNIPFVSVPTAASVDGFVSTVAAMTWKGCKQTFPAVAPVAVIADSDVFAAAPARLTASGVGDMLGKYIALADWRIASLITDEPLCETVFELEREALAQVMAHLHAIASGSVKGCEALMHGLLLSGLAMQMVGTSRPASGAEHHLSHLWEMEVLNPRLDALHGEKVGVGLLLCARVYHGFAEALRKGLPLRGYAGLDVERINRYFSARPGMLDQILTENTPDPLAGIDPDRLAAQRDAMLAALDAIPNVNSLADALRIVNAKTSLKALELPDHVADVSLRVAPYVRRRLTLLRLCALFEGQPISVRA